MSDSGTALFHCGHCGALFEAATGSGVVRRCQQCGADPVPPARRAKPLEGAAGRIDSSPVTTHGARTKAREPDNAARATGRDRRRHRSASPVARNLVIFLGVWVALLGGFAVTVKLAHERKAAADRDRAAQRRLAQPQQGNPAGQMGERERVFLAKAVPECRTALFSFLQSVTPETRAQWVFGGASTIGRMQRFYQSNPVFFPEKMPQQDYVGVLETSEGPLIESIWQSEEGYRIEAVFRRERNEWRLDWEGFARFSEMPWVMYLAGAGDAVEEFRLLARERLAGDRKADPLLSLVFHPPHFGVPDDAGPPSPEFVVPRLSESGKKLEDLFRLRRAGKTPLGAVLPREDPDGMIRVRVRIRREVDEHGTKRFVLEEVLAGHWLGIEQNGLPDAAGTAEKAADGNAPPPTAGSPEAAPSAH